MHQRDLQFITLLTKICFGEADDSVENLLKGRFINESDKCYPHDALNMRTENEPTFQRYKKVLDQEGFTQAVLLMSVF